MPRTKKGQLDARGTRFLELYLSPKSESFGNAYQSAIQAGFSDQYARQILSKSDQIITEIENRRARLLGKAERNLEEFVDVDITQQAMGMFGPIFDMRSMCCDEEVQKREGKDKRKYFICTKCEEECLINKSPVFVRNPKIMALKLDATKFVAETLGKKHYAKKVELGFVDPKDLKLTEAEKKELDDIFAEQTKSLPTPQA